MENLIGDVDWNVRAALITNPNVPLKILISIFEWQRANSKDVYVMDLLVESGKVPDYLKAVIRTLYPSEFM
jgi:hypothetical protein